MAITFVTVVQRHNVFYVKGLHPSHNWPLSPTRKRHYGPGNEVDFCMKSEGRSGRGPLLFFCYRNVTLNKIV